MKIFTRLALKKGLRTADLASQLGVSTQTIYLWKSGQSKPQPEHLKRLAEILDGDIDTLIDDFFLVQEKTP